MYDLPDELVADIDELRYLTGVEPEVTELATHRWRISVRNERVYMELDVRRAKRERCVWLRSALIVDGERRPLARNAQHFARIFHDPDNALPPEGAVLEPMPPAVDPDTLPPVVRQIYVRLARQLGAEKVHVGHEGNRWIVGIDGERGGLRLRFATVKRRTYPMKRYIQVVVDGRDHSSDVKNDITQAMALLSAPATGPAVPGTEGDTAGGTGFGSVGVRRHSVIRN